MKGTCLVAAFTMAVFSVACAGDGREEATSSTASNEQSTVTQGSSSPAAFTETDLEQFERGLTREIDAVEAAQKQAASATDAQARGEAIQAQWETATIPLGAEASGLPVARYRDIREAVNRVFTTLDFQGKIDGPLSIDLERADAATKARVSGDAFAELPPDAATALRGRMDRLVPLWSRYKRLVAVAG